MDIVKLDAIKIADEVVLNKANAKTIAQTLKEEVKERGVSPISIYEKLNFVSKVAEEFCDEEITEAIRKEIEANGKTLKTSNGAELSHSNRRTFSYDHDPIWRRHKQNEDYHKGLREAREQYLKNIPEPDVFKKRVAQKEVDGETGEEFDVLPPRVVKNTESFKLTLK